MKITAAEFADFHKNSWPEGFIIEDIFAEYDVMFTEDGETLAIPPDQKLEMYGYLCWEGDRDADPTKGEGLKLETAIKRWRKQNSTTTVVVDLPRDKLEQFQEMLKGISGAKLVK